MERPNSKAGHQRRRPPPANWPSPEYDVVIDPKKKTFIWYVIVRTLQRNLTHHLTTRTDIRRLLCKMSATIKKNRTVQQRAIP